MEYKISEEMAQRIVFYLSQFPYKEVADIIDYLKEQGQKIIQEHEKGENYDNTNKRRT